MVGGNCCGGVAFLLNDGVASPGTFGSIKVFPGEGDVGNQSRGPIEVADLDGDTRLDVVIGNQSPNISVFLNIPSVGAPGVAFFRTQLIPNEDAPLVNPSSANGLAVADHDGDGIPDLAANSLISGVHAFKGIGAGIFLPAVTYAAGSCPGIPATFQVKAADFDGDGNQDLAASNFACDTISVLVGDGLGSFSAPLNLPSPIDISVVNGPGVVLTEDVNGDSKVDLLILAGQSRTVAVLLNTTVTGPTPSNIDLGPTFATNDVDEDHTVTAIVRSDTGEPVPDITVDFVVTTGPNAPTSDSADTDANGEASFTYTGSGGAGVDTIFANIETLVSNPALKLWVLPNDPPVAICQGVTVEGCAAQPAAASIDGGSFDPDGAGDIASIVQAPPGPYGVDTLVTLTITDLSGASDVCQATVTVVDTAAPAAPVCNAPETIHRRETPISFTATATDACSEVTVEVTGFECVKPRRRGGSSDSSSGSKSDSSGRRGCRVEADGATLSILRPGGNGTIINWTVTATDASGDSSTAACSTQVVKPPKAKSISSKSTSSKSGSKVKSDDSDEKKKKKRRRNRRGRRGRS